MSSDEKTLWGIHAGRLGDADSLFLKKNVIAIGWHEMDCVTSMRGNRELHLGRPPRHG
jgi:restriction system protein